MNVFLRPYTQDDLQIVYELINKSYAIEEGNTGVAFKNAPRLRQVEELEHLVAKTHVHCLVEKDSNKIVGKSP